MTSATLKTATSATSVTEAEVASGFRQLPPKTVRGSRKSLGASVTEAEVPLSKREREEEGELTPSPLSLLSYSLPQTPEKRAAALAGLLARWCDLTGNVPDATKGETHAGKFSAHLDQLAAEKRRIESIAF